MDADTTRWIEAAIAKCEDANRKGVSLILQRDRVQGKDDVICCSAISPEAITALGTTLNNAPDETESEDEE